MRRSREILDDGEKGPGNGRVDGCSFRRKLEMANNTETVTLSGERNIISGATHGVHNHNYNSWVSRKIALVDPVDN